MECVPVTTVSRYVCDGHPSSVKLSQRKLLSTLLHIFHHQEEGEERESYEGEKTNQV